MKRSACIFLRSTSNIFFAFFVLIAALPMTAWGQTGIGISSSNREASQLNRETSPLLAPYERSTVSNYGDLPLAFESNQGQTEEGVQFVARARGILVRLRDREAWFTVLGGEATKPATIRMAFVGAAFSRKPEAIEKQEGISNYLLGDDPANWHTDIANYGRVKYVGLYPGVDLVFYGNHRKLEHDFEVAAGADYRQIEVRLEGATGLAVDHEGNLRVKTPEGDINFQAPEIYQDRGNRRVQVNGRYVVTAENKFRFELDAYDTTLPVVIDPVLSYSTYLAGTASDFGTAIAVDAHGNAYVTGYTYSGDFPVKNPLQPTCNGTCNPADAFITKFNPSGRALVYSTFVGGTNSDQGVAIAVDAVGNAVVVGATSSFDFPQKNGMTVVLNSNQTHGFAFSLTPAGTAFNFSTYLGGVGQDGATGVATDATGNVYVSGSTSSTNFPVTPGNQIGPPPTGYNGSDVFLVKLGKRGKLAFSTMVGGTSTNFNGTFQGQPVSVGVDAAGEAVLGGTALDGFPTTAGAYQPNYPGMLTFTPAAFVGKLNASGSAFLEATYLGGTGGDNAVQVRLDAAANVYIAGTTSSLDFPTTPGAFQPVHAQNGQVSFITKMNAALSNLIYSTYLESTGTSGYGVLIAGLAVDGAGNSIVVGSTSQPAFPLVSPLVSQLPYNFPYGTGTGAFLSVLNPAGSALSFSTYLVGSTGSSGSGVAVDNGAHALMVGVTVDTDFPTTAGAFQPTLPVGANNQQHAFVTEFLLNQGNPAVCVAGSPVQLVSYYGKPSAVVAVPVTNCGTVPLKVTGTTSTNPVFSVTSVGCTTVAPGASCTLHVIYSPLGKTYSDNGTILISDNTPISPQVLSVAGSVLWAQTNIPYYGINLGDEVLGMTSSPNYFRVQNTGYLPLHITSVSATGDYTAINQCPKTVQPGFSCLIGATFTPTVVGPSTGSLLVNDNTISSPESLGLFGTGLASYPAPSSLTMNPTSAPVGSAAVPVYLYGYDIFPVSTLTINGKPFAGRVTYWNGALQFTLPASLFKKLGSFTVQVVNPAPGGASLPIAFGVYRQTILGATDMVFEPFTQKFYASIPASSTTNPNSLVSIDSNTGVVSAPIAIGSDPGALGLSDDGQVLYVSLKGENAVVPFNLATQTAGTKIFLGIDPLKGPLTVSDIQVQPGHSDTAVVTLMAGNYNNDGVAMIQNGQVVSEFLNEAPNNVLVGGMRFVGPSDVYGWDQSYLALGMLHFVVVGNQLLQAPGFSTGYGVGAFATDGTNLFDVNGKVYAASTGAVVADLGISGAAVLRDPNSGRIFLGEGAASVFEANSLSLVGTIGGLAVSTPRLEKWGPDGLGYLTGNSYPPVFDLVQVRSNLFFPAIGPNPLPAPTMLNPASVTSQGPNFMLTVSGAQFVPGAVVQWNGADRTTRFVDASTLQVDVPASDIATAGTARISVVNPMPGGGKSAAIGLPIL